MEKLNRLLELIELGLHKLLRTSGKIVKRVFNPSTLHNLLSFLDGLLFSLFDDLPQLVTQAVDSLMELLLSLLILSEVWVLISELVEMFNKVI
jgi:hypothetical protein